MNINIGDRVYSEEVEMNFYDEIYQKKQLEVVEFISKENVKCKYFNENIVNPNVEYYEVSLKSLEFISKTPLNYKGLENDPFFDF